MRRSRWLSAAVLGALGLALLVPASASAGTLDQQQTNAPGVGPAVWVAVLNAQVFTPTLSGQLDRVDVLLNRVGTPGGDLTVQIWATSAGAPSSPIAGASATVPMASIPTGSSWVQVPISAPSVAGTKYAIVLSDPNSTAPDCGPPNPPPPDTDPPCLRWGADDSGPYPDLSYLSTNGGASWFAQTRDYAFKTYVAGGTTPKTNPSKLCKAQAAAMGSRAAFNELWGKTGTSNGHGKCVSSVAKARNAGATQEQILAAIASCKAKGLKGTTLGACVASRDGVAATLTERQEHNASKAKKRGK